MATGRKIQPVIRGRGRDFFFTEAPRPAMGLVKSPVQWAPIVLVQWGKAAET